MSVYACVYIHMHTYVYIYIWSPPQRSTSKHFVLQPSFFLSHACSHVRAGNTAKTIVFCNSVIGWSSDSNSPPPHGVGQIRNRKPPNAGLSPHKIPQKHWFRSSNAAKTSVLAIFSGKMEGTKKTKILVPKRRRVPKKLKKTKVLGALGSLAAQDSKTLVFWFFWYPLALWHQNFGFLGTPHGFGSILEQNLAKTLEGTQKKQSFGVLSCQTTQCSKMFFCFFWTLQRFGTKTLVFFGTLHGFGKAFLQNAPKTLRGPKSPNQAMGSENLRIYDSVILRICAPASR